ncbi:MAG: Ig-like domain-containing protein [Candidatus Kerfeldbacteria bacterium]|nr:Ig-like domain-containing protein [Candidatus Kerfeldbacteria bacterium]
MKKVVLASVLSLLLWSCGKDKATDPGGQDPTPPTVVSTTPANGSTDIPADIVLQATFSHDMDAGTLTNATFTVSNGVTGSVSYSNKVATFTPSASLTANTSYTATISTGAKDGAGTPLVQAFSWSFTTANPPTVTDIDGNVYQTVTIGSQVWMKENLKVTHYRNSDPILHVTDNAAWLGSASGAYCDYDNNSDNVSTYGRHYNGFVLNDSRGIAPDGWHIPSDDEWLTLERQLGMTNPQSILNGWRGTTEGGMLKAQGYWANPNEGATNASGFTALPAGFRYPNGSFQSQLLYGGFWTSTLSGTEFAYARALSYDTAAVYRAGYDRRQGMSIRCVKD